MNVMHAAVSGGAVLGALIAGALLNVHWSYQHVLVTLALLSLLIGVVTSRVQFPPRARRDAPGSEGLGATLAWMTRRPRILVLVVLCLLAASGEALASFWSVIHLRTLGASLLVSGAAFALFNGAMFIGRLLNALIVAHGGTRASLTLSGGGVLVATALLTSQRVPIVVAAFVVLGLAVAGVIPTLLSAAARLSPGYTTSISSLILAASFTGYIVIPPVIGWAAALVGLHAALLGTLGAIGLAMLGFIRAVHNET
jgi:fucose permease